MQEVIQNQNEPEINPNIKPKICKYCGIRYEDEFKTRICDKCVEALQELVRK